MGHIGSAHLLSKLDVLLLYTFQFGEERISELWLDNMQEKVQKDHIFLENNSDLRISLHFCLRFRQFLMTRCASVKLGLIAIDEVIL